MMAPDMPVQDMKQSPLTGRSKRKMHPHKFTLWVSMGSMLMMFAGLTSAYIVKSNQAAWVPVKVPALFWMSTALILSSSILIQLSLKFLKQGKINRYLWFAGSTILCGIVFLFLQWFGFLQLWEQQVRFKGSGAGQFLYVTFGLHALHIIGGIIALVVQWIKSFAGVQREDRILPAELMSTYWHFAGLLWMYILFFFLLVG